jgi:predicted nucleic acid-binding protein
MFLLDVNALFAVLNKTLGAHRSVMKWLDTETNGHNAAVDDYLVQIASNAGCRLATLDRALATRWPERTVLIN